jgi:argininosuccinate synthase
MLMESTGLDTSVILAWLIEKGYSVVAFLADVVRADCSSVD